MKFQRHFIMEIENGQGNIVQITDPLTLEFFINRNDSDSANTAWFKIYNLAPKTRDQIYKDYFTMGEYRKMKLRAGYNDPLPIIFNGSVFECKSYRMEGSADVITEIRGFDGGWAFANAYSNFNMAAGSNRIDALKLLIRDLRNTALGGVSTKFNDIYQRTRIFADNTISLLKTETKNNFFIDNEKAYCATDNEYIDGSIIVISSETGMLGSPQRMEAYIRAEMLFEPRFKVWGLAQLLSDVNPRFNGVYKVKGLVHYGTISGACGGPFKTVVDLLATDNLEQLTAA